MSQSRRRVLFVDDEPRILEAVCRMLRPQRHELEVVIAPGGDEALALLAQDPVDVVVSDMRMPKMDGAELLALVRQNHPRIVRIILSGQSDRDTIVRATRAAHQFLSKPCDPNELRTTIARSCALRDLLPDSAMQERVAALEALPSVPGALEAVRAELAGSASPERLARLIATEPGLASKILQITSTSFFGTPRGILAPGEATKRLGGDVLRAMASGGALPGPGARGLDHGAWAANAQRTAHVARACAKLTAPALADAAEIAGLLHDCGVLALACAPGSTEAARRSHDGGANPVAAGAFLLALWGLPDPVVEAVACHRQPGPQQRHPLLCSLVHAAHVLAGDPSGLLDGAAISPAVTPDQVASWRRIAEGMAT
jgi:DNA-binding NarL/FixJ family response regulator